MLGAGVLARNVRDDELVLDAALLGEGNELLGEVLPAIVGAEGLVLLSS